MARINIDKIIAEMAVRKWSWSRLADEAGLSRSSLSIITGRGTTGPENLGKIAEALDLEPEELIK